MADRRPRGVVIGVVYFALGVLFLLDRFDWLHLRATYVPPALLIAFGVALLAGGGRRALNRDWD